MIWEKCQNLPPSRQVTIWIRMSWVRVLKNLYSVYLNFQKSQIPKMRFQKSNLLKIRDFEISKITNPEIQISEIAKNRRLQKSEIPKVRDSKNRRLQKILQNSPDFSKVRYVIQNPKILRFTKIRRTLLSFSDRLMIVCIAQKCDDVLWRLIDVFFLWFFPRPCQAFQS